MSRVPPCSKQNSPRPNDIPAARTQEKRNAHAKSIGDTYHAVAHSAVGQASRPKPNEKAAYAGSLTNQVARYAAYICIYLYCANPVELADAYGHDAGRRQ